MYDVETGLYYLRSRYYNPVWQRFINADSLVCNNMFYYCYNSPIIISDINGYSGDSVLKRRSIMDEGFGGAGFGMVVGLAAIALSDTVNSLSDQIADTIKDAITTATVIKKDNQQNISLYVLVIPPDPSNFNDKTLSNLVNLDVLYIGITNDPKRREAEHKRKRGAQYRMVVIKSGMTREEARVAEASCISAYTLELLENKRREISPAKVAHYDDILKSVWNIEDLTTDFLLR